MVSKNVEPISGSLQKLYQGNNPVFSLEFFPPKTQEGLVKTQSLMNALAFNDVSFMTVTYGAGGGTREFTRYLVSYITRELHRPAIAHLTCVNHSRDEIRAVLKALKAEGVSHILALRGDAPPGTEFQVTDGGFSCARDLISFIKSEGDFAVACAGYPEMHRDAKSPEAEMLYLKEKQDAGAEIVLTQLFFDVDMFLRFREKAVAVGITAPLVPGIMPISDVHQLERFTSVCGATIPPTLMNKLDPLRDDKAAVVKFGTEYAAGMSEQLLKEGVPGIHLYTLNKSEQVCGVLDACGVKVK